MAKFRLSPKTGSRLPVKQNQKAHQKALHSSADYFEALLRARVYKAMKQLQKEVSISSLAHGIALKNVRQVKELIPRKLIEDTVRKACAQVVRDCVMRGGRLGAVHVKDVLNG